MAFEDEWAQHKAAADGPGTGTRLNGADGEGPSPAKGGNDGNQGMTTSSGDKKKAAKYLEEDLLPDVTKAGKHAGGAMQTVTGSAPAGRVDVVPFGGPGELDKWEIKTGLNTAMKHWGQQVNNVLARLNGEMQGLRAANSLYGNNDGLTDSRIRGLIPPGSGVDDKTPSLIQNPDELPKTPVDPNGPLLPNPSLGPDGKLTTPSLTPNGPLLTDPPVTPR